MFQWRREEGFVSGRCVHSIWTVHLQILGYEKDKAIFASN